MQSRFGWQYKSEHELSGEHVRIGNLRPMMLGSIAALTILAMSLVPGKAIAGTGQNEQNINPPNTFEPIPESSKEEIVENRIQRLENLGLLDVILQTSGAKISSTQKDDDNKIIIPPEDSGYRRIPRHKNFLNATEAENTILERYDNDQYSLGPKPPMSTEDEFLYKSCVLGKMRYIASYDMGAISTGRVDDDKVGIDIFSMDDCSKFREFNVVVGLETRDSSEGEFTPANIAPGIIKWFASSPEYGAEYFSIFSMKNSTIAGQGYSCKDNRSLQTRFTVRVLTRSNTLPVTIRTVSEKKLQIIKC